MDTSEDVVMDKDGWIALGLGTFFSLVIGYGLMALMFFSSHGCDEAATPKFMKRREETIFKSDSWDQAVGLPGSRSVRGDTIERHPPIVERECANSVKHIFCCY